MFSVVRAAAATRRPLPIEERKLTVYISEWLWVGRGQVNGKNPVLPDMR